MPDAPAPAATAARVIVASLVRHLIAIAGTAIVTRGYLDQATVNGAIGTIADYLVGGVLIAASGVWA